MNTLTKKTYWIFPFKRLKWIKSFYTVKILLLDREERANFLEIFDFVNRLIFLLLKTKKNNTFWVEFHSINFGFFQKSENEEHLYNHWYRFIGFFSIRFGIWVSIRMMNIFSKVKLRYFLIFCVPFSFDFFLTYFCDHFIT